MTLAEAAEQLYGVDPEEFVARRTALVKQARAAKDRELARAVGELRRPTKSAWLVNLLAREAAEELRGLLDLGAALREASTRLDGGELRRLSAERTRAVQALASRAGRLGAEHGHVASEAQRQEVAQTLTAALVDIRLAELVRAGQIAAAVAYGGFGPVDLTGVSAGPDLVVVSDARDQAVADAEQGLAVAEAELVTAQTDAAKATALADGLAEQIDGIRERLREAEAASREAHESARFARKREQQLSQTVARARANLDAVRSASGDRTAPSADPEGGTPPG